MSRSILCLAGLAVLAGCGGDEESEFPQRVRASATVIYNGQPVEGAHVTFAPQTDGGKPAFGNTDSKGVVELTSFGVEDGAMAGKYVVMVSKTQPAVPAETQTAPSFAPPAGRRAPAKTVDVLPKKYKVRKTTDLFAEVVQGDENDFTFELSD